MIGMKVVWMTRTLAATRGLANWGLAATLGLIACDPTPMGAQTPSGGSPSNAAAERDVSVAAPERAPVAANDSPPEGCESPVRSPDDSVYLCRNRMGDVLLASGEGLQLLHANVHPEPAKWTPSTPQLPAAVQFESPQQLLVDWNNGRPIERLPLTAPAALPQAVSRNDTPRTLADRLEQCTNDDGSATWDVATMCLPEHPKGFPALSADGKHLLAVEEWQSCCADMAKDTLLEYDIDDSTISHPKRTLLWEFDQETGRPTLSARESEQRIAALNQQATALVARPLVPFPKTGTRALRLSAGEVVIADGPVARVLTDGKISRTIERAPFVSRGFCCTGEMPPPDSPPMQCEIPARLARAWLAPEARLLVTETHNHEGADGCEQGPRIDVFHLDD